MDSFQSGKTQQQTQNSSQRSFSQLLRSPARLLRATGHQLRCNDTHQTDRQTHTRAPSSRQTTQRHTFLFQRPDCCTQVTTELMREDISLSSSQAHRKAMQVTHLQAELFTVYIGPSLKLQCRSKYLRKKFFAVVYVKNCLVNTSGGVFVGFFFLD